MAQLLATSPDGTAISCESHGQGRALVIVSGALFASERWQPLVSLLASVRRPIVVDRRGRGRSGDNAVYAPEREIEDLLAVLAAIGEPLDLFGHSSGAILALQVAARLPPNLERLVVYEPPVFFNEADGIAPDLPERLDALLAAGDRGAAVATFLREGPRIAAADLQGLQASAHWATMLAAFAHTVPYDSRVQRSFTADAAELARIRIPALSLVGGASPERMTAGSRTIAARLGNAQLRELPGQQHVPQISAPALLASALNDFLG